MSRGTVAFARAHHRTSPRAQRRAGSARAPHRASGLHDPDPHRRRGYASATRFGNTDRVWRGIDLVSSSTRSRHGASPLTRRPRSRRRSRNGAAAMLGLRATRSASHLSARVRPDTVAAFHSRTGASQWTNSVRRTGTADIRQARRGAPTCQDISSRRRRASPSRSSATGSCRKRPGLWLAASMPEQDPEAARARFCGSTRSGPSAGPASARAGSRGRQPAWRRSPEPSTCRVSAGSPW